MDRFEAARIEAIEPLPSGFADTNEPDLTQHAQVLRGAGLRDAQRASQLVDRSLAALEQDEDSPPLWFGDGVERVGCGRGSRHVATIYAHIGIFKSR
jgi:hypothetical protein